MPPRKKSAVEVAAGGDGSQRRTLRSRASAPVYGDEDQDDATFELSLEIAEKEEKGKERNVKAGASKTLRKPRRTEAQIEAEVADAFGIHPYVLTPEEDLHLPPTLDVGAYCEIRNHILAKWNGDPKRWLTLQAARSKISERHDYLVKLAWQFLSDHGHINYGILPQADSAKLRPAPCLRRHSVIVVGAGLAGLAAARQLTAAGHEVVVVEGRDVAGGRVLTSWLQGGEEGGAVVADLGGSVVTGINGNPISLLAAQINAPLHMVGGDAPLHHPDGSVVDAAVDEQMRDAFDDLLGLCNQAVDALGPDSDRLSLGQVLWTLWRGSELAARGDPTLESVFAWYVANLEFANASTLEKVSLTEWDQDDEYELQGSHALVSGGNVRLVEGLAEGLDIMFNTVVERISYSRSSVTIRTTAGQTLTADAALVTVPLGILKRDLITFDPPLPPAKRDTIQRIGFGVLNKVVMLFPRAFWGSVDMIGRLVQPGTARGLFYLMYSYKDVGGGAVLVALAAGEAAVEVERRAEGEVVAEVVGELRRMYGKQGVTVPDPLDAVVTRWGSDPMSYGSYSSMAVGTHGRDYQILAQPVAGRLFFAGEATTNKYPATMHGAYHTGLREAANIMETLDTAPAPEELQAAEGLSATQLLEETAKLEHLFRGPLDAEFGCCAALYAPPGPLQDYALLRVLVPLTGRDQRSTRDECVPVYRAIPRALLSHVRSVRGGDGARLTALHAGGVNILLGRAGIGATGLEIANRLLAAQQDEAGREGRG